MKNMLIKFFMHVMQRSHEQYEYLQVNSAK